MPTLGQKIYDKLKNNPQLDDEDSQKLRESLNAMALFFRKMATKSSGDIIVRFVNAYQSCKDMADAVANHTTDTLKAEDYSNFDEAWKVIFPDNDTDYSTLNTNLNNLSTTTEIDKNISYPQIPPITLEQINRIHDDYNQQTSGLLAGKNLIKGIRGLQTYIIDSDGIDKALCDDLNKKIEHVEEGIKPYQQALENSSGPYLEFLKASLDSSHRWFNNSPEYGDMLDSAKNLCKKWKKANSKTRTQLAAKAYRTAKQYITYKKGRNNDDPDWTPITKEGKKRFKLAQYLLETVTGLFGDDLTNPDKEDLIDDVNIPENGIIEKKVDDIFKNNANNIIEDDIFKNNANNIIEDDISKKNENDIPKKNEIIGTNQEEDPRDESIKQPAKDMLDDSDQLAKAVALNLIMKMGIDGVFGSESTPEQIFSDDRIDKVAKAVKETKMFKTNRNSLKQMVSNTENDHPRFKAMELEAISQLIDNMPDLNINLEDLKKESAKITSTQPKQGIDANGNQPIGNKSNDIKPIGTGKKL